MKIDLSKLDTEVEYNVYAVTKDMYPVGKYHPDDYTLVRGCWPGWDISEDLIHKLRVDFYNVAKELLEVYVDAYGEANLEDKYVILYRRDF